MAKLILPALLCLLLPLSACEKVDSHESDVREVLHQAARDWSAGDLEGYMDSYWESDQLRFAGGGGVNFGWQRVLDRYRVKYPDTAAMGRLRFTELDVKMIDADNALVFGRWILTRETDQPNGVFTLLMKRFPEGWKIIHDHSSSGEPNESAAVATITAEDLLTKVTRLSDPALSGRLPGTDGYQAAAMDMAARFAELGLEPGGEDGYFQHLPIESNVVLPGCRLTRLEEGHAVKDYTLGDDYIFRGFTGAGDVAAEVVFCGYGLSAPERGYDDYADVDVAGKIVLVFKQGPGWKIDDDGWGSASHPRPKALTAAEHGAVAVLMVSKPGGSRVQPLIGSVMHGAGDQPGDMPQVQVSLAVAADLLGGPDVLEDLQTRIDIERAPASHATNTWVALKVETQYEKEADTVNVVGLLPGTDPVLKDEYLVLGAHLDHVGTQGGTLLFPGANDNASGSAAVLEMAEAFVHGGVEPRRTVIFVLFSGEEQGLIGSKAYAENPARPLDKTVAMFNLDCVAHGDSISAGNGKSAPVLHRLVKDLDADHANLTVAGTWGGGGADAAPFHDRGVPAVYFASRHSYTHLHLASDTVETLNPDLYRELTRLAFRAAERVAAGDYEREEIVP